MGFKCRALWADEKVPVGLGGSVPVSSEPPCTNNLDMRWAKQLDPRGAVQASPWALGSLGDTESLSVCRLAERGHHSLGAHASPVKYKVMVMSLGQGTS